MKRQELKPELNKATGFWEALGFKFQTERVAQAFIDAQDKRWFQRAWRYRRPGRRVMRRLERRAGVR